MTKGTKSNVIIEGYWSNSLMNGAVLNVGGICKTVMCGAHCGCSPVIMEIKKYGQRQKNHCRENSE